MGRLLCVDGTAREYRNVDIIPCVGLYLNEWRNRELDRTLTNDQKLEKGVFRLHHLVVDPMAFLATASWLSVIYQMPK